MKQFKKKEFAIIPTKVKMATKANKPSINAISMNEPMKVVMNFGRNKTEYDELPSGRKYLTPLEIVAIQELNLDDKSPLEPFVMPLLFSAYSVEVLLPMLAIRRILTHTAIVLAYC